MILELSLSVNLDASQTTLKMTPMNVGKARASQVAAIAGRKDAAGALITDNSDDVALVPRGSRPTSSGSISAAPRMVQPKASKRRRQRSESFPDDSELEHPEQT